MGHDIELHQSSERTQRDWVTFPTLEMSYENTREICIMGSQFSELA